MSWFDELVSGAVMELGEHVFTAEEIITFATAFDPQPFHLDAEKARHSLFGGLCASGWHVTAVFMKLNVATMNRLAEGRRLAGLDEPQLGPSPGIEKLRWLRPVYAGDRLAYRSTVLAARHSASRPGWGILQSRIDAQDQEGRPALTFEASLFLRS